METILKLVGENKNQQKLNHLRPLNMAEMIY